MGVELIWNAIKFKSFCLYEDRSVDFGKYLLKIPLLFSFKPLWQGLPGSAK